MMHSFLFVFLSVTIIGENSFANPLESGACREIKCGKGAKCEQISNLVACICPENSIGDPFVECKFRGDSTTEAGPTTENPMQNIPLISKMENKNNDSTKTEEISSAEPTLSHYAHNLPYNEQNLNHNQNYNQNHHGPNQNNQNTFHTQTNMHNSNFENTHHQHFSHEKQNNNPTYGEHDETKYHQQLNQLFSNSRNKNNRPQSQAEQNNYGTFSNFPTSQHFQNSNVFVNQRQEQIITSPTYHEAQNGDKNSNYGNREHPLYRTEEKIEGESNGSQNQNKFGMINSQNQNNFDMRDKNTHLNVPIATGHQHNFEQVTQFNLKQEGDKGAQRDPLGIYADCKAVNNRIVCADLNPHSESHQMRTRPSPFEHRHSLSSPTNSNNFHYQNSPSQSFHKNDHQFVPRPHHIRPDRPIGSLLPHPIKNENSPQQIIIESTKSDENSANCKKLCGENSVCKTFMGRPVCGCPEGHTGDPAVKCFPELNSKYDTNSCLRHTDCSLTKSCVNFQCSDPCSAKNGFELSNLSSFHSSLDSVKSNSICGANTKCIVIEHTALCSCEQNFYGNPYVGCVA